MGLKSDKPKKPEGLALLLDTREEAVHKFEDLDGAVRYVLEDDACFVQGGAIVFDVVDAVLHERTSLTEPPVDIPEGRVGDDHVTVDLASRFGRLAVDSDDAFVVESRGNFSSCRATHCFFAGRWMYEAIVNTDGIQQIGWATLTCPFTREEGVGDGVDSYAYDGKRVKKWSIGAAQYGQAWTVGDVIGCCADLDQGELSFYRNGKSMGTAFRDIRVMKPELGYFPAVSLSEGERCTLNFGGTPFRYPIDGYRSCEHQPSSVGREKVGYLIGCMERLAHTTCHITGREGSKFRLPSEEGTLLASVIVGQLHTHLYKEFHIVDAIVPSFRRVLGKLETPSTMGLVALIDLYAAAMSASAFRNMIVSVLEHVAEQCVIAPFRNSELPHTAAYPHLCLFLGLMKSPIVRRLFFDHPRHHRILEKCLARKQPTSEDLKEVLPTVWWKGCKDEGSSEEMMASMESALSTAYIKIEQRQFELLMLLTTEDTEGPILKPKRRLVQFLVYLLEKNAGATRNILPAGLSDRTVMVTMFHYLMSLLRQSFVMENRDGPDVLEHFPVKDLFIRGILSQEASVHENLTRLGGFYSHLIKEIDNPEPDVVSVMIDPAIFSTESPRYQIPPTLIPELLHGLLLTFRLGIQSSIKLVTPSVTSIRILISCFQSMHLFQQESHHQSSLSKLESKLIDPEIPEREKKQLSLEIQKQKEEVIRSIRESIWYRIIWFTPSKQKTAFMLMVYLSKLMNSVSKSAPDLFDFVPEIYVEAILEIFQSLARMESLCIDRQQMEIFGMQHVLSFLVEHFNHPKIVNPHICDSILHALATVFADKDFLKMCERNADARQHLIHGLIRAFDTRYWLSVSNIFLSIAKGTGFGHASTSNGSLVFRDFFVNICNADLSLLNGFLNRLFNTLNWTMTELVITFGELATLIRRVPHVSGPLMMRQPRKASVLFNLSVNLLRLLEMVTGQIPAAFLTGSKLNITRVIEVVGYVMAHTTLGPDALAFNDILNARTTGQEWKNKLSKVSILAPVAGTLIFLHSNQLLLRPHSSGNASTVEHSIVRLLAEDLSCPSDRLHYLLTLDWRSIISNLHKTHWLQRLEDFLKDYERARIERQDSSTSHLPEEIPEDFLDPILMTVMKDPVVLPDSKVTVDRSTIERHLLTSATDPFSRAELTVEMLIPNVELQDSIAQWMRETSK